MEQKNSVVDRVFLLHNRRKEANITNWQYFDLIMGNINKAHIEAIKALQNAKEGSEIPEENVKAIKEAHRKFLEEQNKQNALEITEESSSPASATSDVQSAYLLSESQRYKRKWITMVVCAICLLLLHGVGIYFLFQHKSNYICSPKPVALMPGTLKFDTIRLPSILFCYPVQVGDYDLSLFHIELFQRFITNSRRFGGEEDLITKQAKDLDFKSALVKGVYLIDWNDYYTMNVHCSYDSSKGWIEAEQQEYAGNIIIEESFIYDLNKQSVMSFDDIFPPEKQYGLKKFLRQRLIEEHPTVRTYSDKTLKEMGQWDFSIEPLKRLKKDNVWYYEFTCHPDLDLPRAYMSLSITIAERGLANYLSYTPE